MQQLVATVAPHTEIINAFGKIENANANSADSVNSDVPIPDVSTVAPIQIRDELFRGHLSVTGKLGE